jgi:hypothetical protein
MLRHLEPTKTSHSINNKANVIEQLKKWISPHFKDTDCFVTLTFQPYVKLNEIECSRDVKCLLDRLNRAIYGKAGDVRKKRSRSKYLKSCPVFEQNLSEGVHVHMLLERPEDESRFTGDFDKLIIDTWYQLGRSGNKNAQDVRPSYCVEGAVIYMTKQIKTGNGYLNFDFNNIYLDFKG